jgi:sugar/nucleoside kinase (ribokinase family)
MTTRNTRAEALDFLAVGHVTIDRLSGSTRIGGAAAYAALTAARLGLSTGIVTSVGPEFPFWEDLDDVEVHYVEGERTTEFENVYEGGERRQRILAVASPLTEESLESILPRLREDAAVLYGPVAQEIRAPLLPLAPKGLCGVAPQGFYRRWDENGFVVSDEWHDARAALARVDFVSMSEEDHVAPEELAEEFAGRAFAVTKGASGCRVYSGGGADVFDFPAFPAMEVDPTGAGDVFAAAFLVALREKRPVPLAARFATAAASFVVEGPGVSAIPTRYHVERRLL